LRKRRKSNGNCGFGYQGVERLFLYESGGTNRNKV
jgi:hypothetical protein